jgi:predicted nucleotidyltransferase
MKPKNIVNQLKDIFSDVASIEFAYLFGSYACGDTSKHSDIDIAIYVKDGFDSYEVGLEVHHKLELIFLKEVDLVVLNSAKNYYLLKDIIYKGILVKDGENRAMFEVRKQHEIIDFLDFRRMLDVA